MRLLVEHPAAALVAAGLEAVPFNCLGFGLFPPGRVGDPDSPCLSLWALTDRLDQRGRVRARSGGPELPPMGPVATASARLGNDPRAA